LPQDKWTDNPETGGARQWSYRQVDPLSELCSLHSRFVSYTGNIQELKIILLNPVKVHVNMSAC